jgi:hypothetical protein
VGWQLQANDLISTIDGGVGIGVDVPGVKLDVAGAIRSTEDVLPYGYTQTETINVRSIFPKPMANAVCPSGSSASYVPWRWRGKSGNEICAADVAGMKACYAVKLVYVTAANATGTDPQYDLPCGAQVHYPWPWGQDYSLPDIFDGEYLHGNVHVVCCK